MSKGTPRRRNLTGMKFNRLTVLSLEAVSSSGAAMWNCLCDCGNAKIAAGSRLVKGYTRSCGCDNRKDGVVTKRDNLLRRFFSYIAQPAHGHACWFWTGPTAGVATHRYGTIMGGWQRKRAHILSWEIHHGRQFPIGMHALHSCDNPSCVNPEHIRPGTPKDNMRDMVERGRNKKQGRVREKFVKQAS